MTFARPLLGVLVLVPALFLLAACDETDLLSDDPLSITGKVRTADPENPGENVPVADVHVWFSQDPGDNTSDELNCWTHSDGKYYLEVYMDEDNCAPLRFFQFGYYEQDHRACESRGDQRIDALIVSATDAGRNGNCDLLCDRFNNCNYFFRLIYEDLQQCVDHCREGCVLSYLSCAFDFNDNDLNENDKCDELHSCFLDYCDEDWLDPGDDDSADDDSTDDDSE